jgi:hypothetical protein
MKGLPKNKFTPEEDMRLKEIIRNGACEDWAAVASHFPDRNPRQCRERWNNYVNPAVMKLPWTPMEDFLLEQKYAELGPKWQIIAKFFPTRSKNYVKNRWLTIQRRLRKGAEIGNPLRAAEPAVSPPAAVEEVAAVHHQPDVHSSPLFEDPFFWSHEQYDELWNPFEFSLF